MSAPGPRMEVLPDPAAVASRAAAFIAADARTACAERGRFVLAVSGGRTPWVMLEALAREDVPWHQLQIVQVDERVAPDGSPDRNLTHLRQSLLLRAPIDEAQVHAMPVGDADLEQGARDYASRLERLTQSPPIIDLVHLGLGPDGHTASLVPGDPVLEVRDRDVAAVGVYQGHRRMTLTYPILDRARRILWVVTGEEKRDALRRLRERDSSVPAGRVSAEHATIIADAAATGADASSREA